MQRMRMAAAEQKLLTMRQGFVRKLANPKGEDWEEGQVGLATKKSLGLPRPQQHFTHNTDIFAHTHTHTQEDVSVVWLCVR